MGQTKEQIRIKRNKYQREYQAKKRKEGRSLLLPKPKRKVGRAPKGVDLLDNFNFTKTTTPSKAELKQIKEVFALPPPLVAPFPDDTPNGLDKNAYQMLGDMREAYRRGGGKAKLAEFALSDDKTFVFLVKELMKLESALLAAKIRKEAPNTASAGNQQNFFVVIKGLEQDPAANAIEMGKSGIDFIRFQQAVDPTYVGRNALDEEVFKEKNGAPDMLFGSQNELQKDEDIDPWEGLDDAE